MKKIIVMLSACLFLAGCQTRTDENRASEENGISEPEDEGTEVAGDRSLSLDSWVVYWDMDNVEKELDVLGENLSTLSYFEAYFDESNHLKVPKNFMEACRELDTSTAETFLTVVNDIVYEEKDNVLKDTNLLYQLLQEEEDRTSHIDELVTLAKEWKVDGIEIDYEGIKKDEALWDSFETFCSELEAALTQNDLKLRIVLEPSAPFDTLQLPENAEYTIMCYNLHSGVGNEGPKADEAFLRDLVKEASLLGRNCTFALATGGFDWTNDDVVSLTETEANALAAKYNAEVKRDRASNGLTFSYQDDSGKAHTVWYADGQTITTWIDWIQVQGAHDIAIWRLNGNETDSVMQWVK